MNVFVCDPVRTPIGRYGGALSRVRTDDLAAIPIRALIERHPSIREAVDEVYLGCANQAGEDNRNVARMALLLAGLPDSVPGVTLNRLCASGPRRGRRGGARDPRRRDRACDCRRRGIDVARALRHGEGDGGIPAERRDLRHDDRLALHQPAAEAAIRRRFDAGDRRERGAGFPGEPRRPGRASRSARSSARPRPLPLGASTTRCCRSTCRRGRGRQRA